MLFSLQAEEATFKTIDPGGAEYLNKVYEKMEVGQESGLEYQN